MLEGFISRWATPFPWMYFKALAIWSMMSTTTGKENGTLWLGWSDILLSIYSRRSVDMSSITMEHASVSFVQQISSVMLGCLRLVQMAASFLNSVYHSVAAGNVFIAQSSSHHDVLWTSPKAPCPNCSITGSALSPSMSHRRNGKSPSTAQSLACCEYLFNKYCCMASPCLWKLEWCCLNCVKFSKSSLLSKSASVPRGWSSCNQLRFSLFPTDKIS